MAHHIFTAYDMVGHSASSTPNNSLLAHLIDQPTSSMMYTLHQPSQLAQTIITGKQYRKLSKR